MKYVALLRGINVGGNSSVKMSELKEVFEKIGFTNVITYINSGNVIFESDEKGIKKLTNIVEALLEKNFFPIKTIVISHDDLQTIVTHVPQSWKKENLRKYVAFLKESVKPNDVIREVQLKEGIDFIDKGSGVVYLSTKMEGLTKSNFPKLIQKKIYKDMTMRNFNTVQKLLTLMEE